MKNIKYTLKVTAEVVEARVEYAIDISNLEVFTPVHITHELSVDGIGVVLPVPLTLRREFERALVRNIQLMFKEISQNKDTAYASGVIDLLVKKE